MTFAQMARNAIIVIAIIAIVLVAASAMGVAIPPFVWTLFWIIAVAAICILAIRFLTSLN